MRLILPVVMASLAMVINDDSTIMDAYEFLNATNSYGALLQGCVIDIHPLTVALELADDTRVVNAVRPWRTSEWIVIESFETCKSAAFPLAEEVGSAGTPTNIIHSGTDT